MTIYHISIKRRILHFKQPAKTSRGVYTTRQIWLLELTSPYIPGIKGLGECAPLPDLSCDAIPDYERVLHDFCSKFENEGCIDYDAMLPYPSMLFGLETAWLQFSNEKRMLELGITVKPAVPLLFDTPFTHGEDGILTNGLIWMGSRKEMGDRIEDKLMTGFRCIKLKMGAIDFSEEVALIKGIRSCFSNKTVELRVDANGAFTCEEAMYKLELLALFSIHSIEQPIKQGQWTEMTRLCRNSPLPIALDEELIGINARSEKERMLDTIMPAYIVLKPSLHGGVHGVEEWVKLANERGIGSWITSALESNIGLNATAQLAAHIYGKDITMPQGLGTGQLFTDNIPMQLEMKGAKLWVGTQPA